MNFNNWHWNRHLTNLIMGAILLGIVAIVWVIIEIGVLLSRYL